MEVLQSMSVGGGIAVVGTAATAAMTILGIIYKVFGGHYVTIGECEKVQHNMCSQLEALNTQVKELNNYIRTILQAKLTGE